MVMTLPRIGQLVSTLVLIVLILVVAAAGGFFGTLLKAAGWIVVTLTALGALFGLVLWHWFQSWRSGT